MTARVLAPEKVDKGDRLISQIFMKYHHCNTTTGAEDTRVLVSPAPKQLYRVVDYINNRPDQRGHLLSRRAAQCPDAAPIVVSEDVAQQIRDHVAIWGCDSSPFISTTTDPLWALWKASRLATLPTQSQANKPGEIQILLVRTNRDVFDLSRREIQNILYAPCEPDPRAIQRYASSSSEVLILDLIRKDEISATIPIESIVKFIPRFLNINTSCSAYVWKSQVCQAFAEDPDGIYLLANFLVNVCLEVSRVLGSRNTMGDINEVAGSVCMHGVHLLGALRGGYVSKEDVQRLWAALVEEAGRHDLLQMPGQCQGESKGNTEGQPVT
ncbi:hypothetical protein CYLTODRAFT_415167 [Cylindrobasidium torrendii FP15055 ss-10]|uniref:DUF7587 domain-containing protein n=1 Tax=Cylindrobasidium torrendii FP15055 ss-10 TaxID=1314674 RepID=A0A0D7AV06_9AGAR|nr:hypothetical protein CYLTODRAFT_415167 [Cylindrobasidium torrendii FP15055 ss-10]